MDRIITQSWSLLRLYWDLEGKSRQTLSGVFLYVLVIILVTAYIFGSPDPGVWMGIFWVILIFSAVNIGVLSYLQETGGRRLYYMQLAEPLAVYLAKSLYIFLLLLLVSLVSILLMSIFHGWPVLQPGFLWSGIGLGCLGLALLFGFLAAIGSQSRNSATLSTIISFPLIIGLVMLAGKITNASLLAGSTLDLLEVEFLMLGGLNLMIGGLGILLFNYIWRD
ncbi:MAG: hypothetical protein IPJ06_13720 [Saprospiraceae bacterium]|nr:hypothetical protein [Saprospiraceae bacterium]